jgi:hypothetical protein
VTWRRRNGDFARFIAEYQQEPGESSTDAVDSKERIAELAVSWVVIMFMLMLMELFYGWLTHFAVQKEREAMVMKKMSQATLSESKKSLEPGTEASKEASEKQALESTKLIQKEGAAEVSGV